MKKNNNQKNKREKKKNQTKRNRLRFTVVVGTGTALSETTSNNKKKGSPTTQTTGGIFAVQSRQIDSEVLDGKFLNLEHSLNNRNRGNTLQKKGNFEKQTNKTKLKRLECVFWIFCFNIKKKGTTGLRGGSVSDGAARSTGEFPTQVRAT